MGKIFINKNKQLRSGWKIAITLIGAIIVTAIIQLGFVAIAMILWLVKGQTLTQAVSGLPSLFMSDINLYFQPIGFVIAVMLFWKIFERKPLNVMGFPKIQNHWKDFIFGLLLGIVSITAVFVILLNLGMIQVNENLDSPNLIISVIKGLILFIIVGFSEELFSRGYNMSVLKQTGNKWVVLLVPSGIFALLHGLNDNVTFLGLLNIFLIALLFGYMFNKTEHIWIPIGYHITWNFFQGNILGFPVSGLELKGLYKISLIDDNIWNGGKFGAEGGLVTTLIIILGFFAIHFYVKIQKNRVL